MAVPAKSDLFSTDDIHVLMSWVLSEIKQTEYRKHSIQKCKTNAPGLIPILALTLI